MSERDDDLREAFRHIADQAQPSERDGGLLRAARRGRRITAGIAMLSLLAAAFAIGGSWRLWSAGDDERPTMIGGNRSALGGKPARFDETSGRCVGDDGLDICNAELGRLNSVLKNAATAQESFATENSAARYTDRLADLVEEGLQVEPNIHLEVYGPKVSDVAYCIEGFSEELDGTMHYSSMVGSPLPGPCFAELKTVLKNAATAEESYAVGHDGNYTKRLADLQEEGLELPATIDLTIDVSEGKYCIEGRSEELDGTLHFSSERGLPLPGPCSRPT